MCNTYELRVDQWSKYLLSFCKVHMYVCMYVHRYFMKLYMFNCYIFYLEHT
jgi:hypothetical protein